MTRANKGSTGEEAKRQGALVTRITGRWYCSSSNHYTSAVPTTWRGRRICARCKAQIQALRKTANPKRKTKP